MMKDSPKILNVSNELITNLKRLCLKNSEDKMIELVESLGKLSLTGNLHNFLKEILNDDLINFNEGKSKIIHSIILILIYKYNSDFFSQVELNFDDSNFMKNFIKSELNNISNNSEKNLPLLNFNIILIFILILKFKFFQANYQFIDEIIKIKINYQSDNNFNKISNEFLNLSLNINHTNDNNSNKNFNLNFLFTNTEIFDSFLNELNKDKNFNEISLRHFKDQIQINDNSLKNENFSENISTKINLQNILLFQRQNLIIQKILEIYKFNKEQKLLFYGMNSSGKTQIAKLFTEEELLIDIDETLEVNNLLGGYLINEFSEIIWQDGILLKALKENRDIILRNMEKCSNELFFILKQIVERGSFFLNIKQELITFGKIPKLIFIYNTTHNVVNDLIFNFLISNSFPIEFTQYNDEEKIQIALQKCHFDNNNIFKSINDKSNFLQEILEVYRKVTSKYKFNTRFREINLSDLIKFSTRIENFLNESKFTINNLNLYTQNTFISEKNKMKIISTFIHMAFFTLEDMDLIKTISKDFAEKFNFEIETFANSITNFNDMFSNSESPLNIIKNFDDEKIHFDHLAKINSNMYSYNNNSKFYIKLINECIINTARENVLLVGETGVGKTTMIQNLAKIMNTKLNVINLSQSSDVSELFGGFKPIHPTIFLQKYFEKIVKIIQSNFNPENNKKFISSFYEAYMKKDTEYFIKFTMKSIEKLESKFSKNLKMLDELNLIKNELIKFNKATKRGCYNAFTYMDGILLDALKKDEWVLLDEINLANDDLLLKLSPILEGEDIFLVENEELKVYKRGPKFRIFGSMNPEYNIGKKRLPNSLRSQFSEIFVHEIKEFHDIKTFVKTYLNDISCDDKYITEIARFYQFIKTKQMKNEIQKQNSAKCNFSLRTLSRALVTIKKAILFYDIQTSVQEALEMNFLSLMSESSIEMVKSNLSGLIKFDTINKIHLKISDRENFVNLNNYLIPKEYINPDMIDKEIDSKFILTKTFKNHLNNLMRIVTLSDYAVLLEGPTSVGKTSIIEYIGKKIGQKVLRINNNQNTEIEEYIGNYTTDAKGQFYFQEGFLVKAVQEGSWIILDEINLAPSEVLEALNRLLDDNRELFISELNKTIKAHPNFKIFAAMNPAELYGGRKDLSEAFKNRFIHLYFDNIPEEDLEEIIEKRCRLAKSRVKIMVSIFNDLQKVRSSEKIFSKKEGFITIRDLIKWGMRQITSYEDLAYEGFFVIAEKIRNEEEKNTVQKIIEKNVSKYCKTLKIDFEKYFNEYVNNLIGVDKKENDINLCLNKSTKRILSLVDKCLKNKEPVLLIGETGTGKTVLCDYIAQIYNKQMITINCHENIDTSDFLGSLRSVYGREDKIKMIREGLKDIFYNLIKNENNDNHINKYYQKYFLDDLYQNLNIQKCEKLHKLLNKHINNTNNNEETLNNFYNLSLLLQDSHKLFSWMDGPLTTSMRKGSLLLIDEISLAQDSVLERLNSVFEADRVLVLSEKQSHSNVEVIYPDEGFMIIASMNPSGDHGKRELSPALRSRFSEIYIDINNHKELNLFYELGREINNNDQYAIIELNNISDDIFTLIQFKVYNNKTLKEFLNEVQSEILIKLLYHLMIWFNFYLIKNQSQIVKYLTLRDVDFLLDFFISNIIKSNINQTILSDNFISLYYHSVNMTLLDGIFLNESSKPDALIKIKNKIIKFLDFQILYMQVKITNGTVESILNMRLIDDVTQFGILPHFNIEKNIQLCQEVKFVFHTENIKMNLLKILRGLTTRKPILIEGSPGVGKTTIIQNLAKKLGKNIYRINLSEHTDMIDLIGSEYPTDSDNKGITFKWVDGVFLKALVNGDWIIIDEMNLASQSILEGLNSVLDYRKTLYVPELNKEFVCNKHFQIFATQNPVNQGGGRKFLPKSFLNRFVKIYLNDLSLSDYNEILFNLFPYVDFNLIEKLTYFNNLCQQIIYEKHKLNMNEVGEFNLRTLSKILEVFTQNDNNNNITEIIKLMYISRIRKSEVRKEIRKVMNEIFSVNDIKNENELTQNNKIPYIENNSKSATIESSFIQKYSNRLKMCIKNNFPVIITGGSGIGKKEIIRNLANKTNNNLYEFSLNSSMDSTELLGNFDKINLSYHLKNIKEKFSNFIEEINVDKLNNTEYLQIVNLVDFLNKKFTSESLQILKEKLESLNIINLFKEEIYSIERVLEYIQNDTFNFEWHDSTLVQCITNGHWIILDNVNTCSAAVLDRLNSLLDDDKQIYLNECGSSEGRIVKPHHNFRIFMVMNEKFGEVSRALKNRCVEIYFDRKIMNLENIKLFDYPTLDIKNSSKLINFSFNHNQIKIRKNTFEDLLKICEKENLLNFINSFKLSLFYLFYIDNYNINSFVDFRSFKKFINVFYFYFIKNKEDFNIAFEMTTNLVKIKNENSNLININELLFNLDNYFNNQNFIFYHSNNIIDEINNLILNFRFKFDISILSQKNSDLILFDTIIKNCKFSSNFFKDFNNLISKNELLVTIMNNEDEYADSLVMTKSKNKLDDIINKLNNLILTNSNDKISYLNDKIINSENNQLIQIRHLINNENSNKNVIEDFIHKFLIFLINSFLHFNNDNSKENILYKLLENLNTKEIQNILQFFKTKSLIKFYINNLKIKNLDKQMKKLINSKYEENVDLIFNTIYEIEKKENLNLDSFIISIVEFIGKIIEENNNIKYLQLNPDTFFFIVTNIIEKYIINNNCQGESKIINEYKKLYKKLKKIVNLPKKENIENLEEKLSMINFDSKLGNFISYDEINNTITTNLNTNKFNFDNKFLLNLSNSNSSEFLDKLINSENDNLIQIKLNQSPLMNMILLEFDLKSAKAFNDILNLKYYHTFIEKVNEILSNEKLIIPIISSQNDMKNIQFFTENLVNYSTYINDYSIFNQEELFMNNLQNLNFLNKTNIKNTFDRKIIQSLILNKENKLFVHLIKMFLLNEYSGKNSANRIISLSNDIEAIVEHFENDFKKLFFVPFYFFFSKINVENVINNFKNIMNVNKTKTKINIMEKVLKDLYQFILEENIELENQNINKEEQLIFLIEQSEVLINLTIPDKNTLSKILGKDLFKLFYEILLVNKEKILFSDKLLYNSNNSESEYNKEKEFIGKNLTEINSYNLFKQKLNKFEKESFRGENVNYDNFIKDLSNVIDKFNKCKNENINDDENNNNIDELKISLINLINKYLLNFGDIILPFTICLFIYITSKQELLKIKNKNKISKNKSNIPEDNLIYNYLHRLPTTTNLPFIISTLKTKLNEYSEQLQLKEDAIYSQSADSLFILREKLTLYEDMNMKVLDSTNAMDELSKDQKEKLRDEEERKEIEENFPTYASDFKNFDKLELIDLTKSIHIKNFYNNANKNNQNEKTSEFLYQVYKIFEKHLCEKENYVENLSEQEFSLNYYFTQNYLKNTKKSENLENSNLNQILESIFYFYRVKSNNDEAVHNLEISESQIDKISAKKEENLNLKNNYNFYKDANPREMKFLYMSLNKLLEKTEKYLKDYPEHPLLVLIVIITFNLLELNINSTPLSKVISGLDVLLTKLQEWETYASKHINSFREEIHFIMTVVRRYRKIEVLSWRSLLNSKMIEYEKKDILNYFDFMLKIIDSTHNNEKLDETLETLNMFIMNSNFSSFKFRINCLKIISNILDKENNEMINSLNNIYNYYTINFFNNEKFNQYKQSQLEEVETKVKDLSNIAKWDIKNYLRFKDNMQRNYRQLNKILKGFDNLCLTNVKEFIEHSRSEFTSKEYVMVKFKAAEEDLDPKNLYDSLSTEIFSRLESLRALSNSSKVFKHKALIDLIKALKSLGFSTVYKFYQNEVYSQFKLFNLDFIQTYQNYFIEDSLVLNCKKSSAYVVKILEKLNNFNIVEIINEDLNFKYLESMKGLAYSSYFKCLTLFNHLEQLIKIFTLFLKKNYLQELSKSENSINIINEEFVVIYSHVNTLLTNLHMTEFNSIFENKDENSKLLELVQVISFINQNYYQFIQFNSTDENILLLTNKNCKDLMKFLNQLETLVTDDMMNKIDQHYFIINHKIKYDIREFVILIGNLKNKINSHFVINNERNEEEKKNEEYEVDKNYLSFVIEKMSNDERYNNNSYVENNTEIVNIFKNFLLKEVEEVKEINEETNIEMTTEINNENNQDDNLKIDDLLNKLQTVNNFYKENENSFNNLKMITTHISEVSELIHSALKLTNLTVSVFYNITINGFCQTGKANQDKNKNTEGGGVHEGGFGMSEGQGVEDISKQIEDEEQLLGLKEDKKEEEKDEKPDDDKPFDKKSGFEMTTDFKEDERKELSEDEEEENKSMDEDDIEREKDNVDDAKENKMYDKDNEIQDEEKEKKGEDDRGKVDLTDKSVSMEKKEQDKDNNYKAKDKDNVSKGKDRNVDKPEENNEEKDEEKDEDKGENEEDEDNINNEAQEDKNTKIDKLDVDQKDEEEKEEKKGDAMDDEEDNLMDVDEHNDKLDENGEEDPNAENIENGEDDPNGENKDNLGDPNQDGPPQDTENLPDDDLFGDKDPNKQMDIEDDNAEAEGDNNDLENDNDNDEDGEGNNKSGENQDIPEEEENFLPEEEIFKSNPLPTKKEDLGYNPISKNNGSGGNTAQKTEDNKNNPDQKNEDNSDLNKEQLESIDKYEEMMDLNSMLESVWKTRPSKRNDEKKKEINKLANRDNNDNLIEDDKMNVEENFDFQNKPEENQNEQNNENNNENKNEEMDFDQGFADNQQNNNKASGYENEEENKKRKNYNNKEDDNTKRIFEDKNEKMNVDNKEDDNMIVEQEKENKDNSLKDYESVDENEMEIDEENEINAYNNANADNYLNNERNNQNNLKIELDREIEGEIITEGLDKNNSEETLENLKKMENDVIIDFGNWIKSDESSDSINLWNKLEQISFSHIAKLIEHLKIALEPNKQTKLRGNYKSGKRLNIKKIISFIASNYRNDKIWLRRTLPFERNYYITLAIDDSLSMKEHNLGFFAMESLVIVSTALNKAGIGKICICGIKEDMEVYHNFNEMFNREKGSYLLSKFKFDFSSRLSHDVAMTNFMKNSMVMMENLMNSAQGSNATQIVFILSDGRFNKDNARARCMEAKEKGFLYVFIILDKYGLENNNSIINMNSVKHVYKSDGNYDIDVKPYLDDFPFSYYVIVEDSSDLPEVIQTILVKWFTMNSLN